MVSCSPASGGTTFVRRLRDRGGVGMATGGSGGGVTGAEAGSGVDTGTWSPPGGVRRPWSQLRRPRRAGRNPPTAPRAAWRTVKAAPRTAPRTACRAVVRVITAAATNPIPDRMSTAPQVATPASRPPPTAKPIKPPDSPSPSAPSSSPGRPRVMCSRPVTLSTAITRPTGRRLEISPSSLRSRNMARPVATMATGRTTRVAPTDQPRPASTTRPTTPARSR